MVVKVSRSLQLGGRVSKAESPKSRLHAGLIKRSAGIPAPLLPRLHCINFISLLKVFTHHELCFKRVLLRHEACNSYWSISQDIK